VVRWGSVLAGIALLVLVIAWMSGTFHRRIPPGTVPLAEMLARGRQVVPVELVPEPETVQATGTVQPRYLTNVESQVVATILAVPVNPGDRVREGQLLVTLDDREIAARLGDAQAALAAANVELGVRRNEYARYKQMYDGKAVTKEQYESMEGAYRVAEQQVRQAEQQVAQAEVNRTYTRIAAQRAGTVLNRYADPGDLAAPGKPLLALHDPKDLELHASVREQLARDIRPGQQLAVEVDAIALRTVGTVREIVPQAQVASRSVLVKVTLPPEAIARLYAGMFGRLWIPLGSADRIVVPADAVQHVGQLDFVDVVNTRGSLERRFVRTGRRYGADVEILAGLNAGESVALPAASTAPGPAQPRRGAHEHPQNPRRP